MLQSVHIIHIKFSEHGIENAQTFADVESLGRFFLRRNRSRKSQKQDEEK
jgi:hypothetical protein